MRVRREVSGRETCDVTAVEHERPPEVGRKPCRKYWATLKQMRYPEPRQASKSHFQAAGPVDSNRIRILLLPVIPLPEKLQSKLGPLRQAICLGQRHQVL